MIVMARRRRRLWLGLMVATATAALSVGLEEAVKPAQSQTRTAPSEAARPAIPSPRPIPEAGSLGQPKSLDQVGLPAELTRQAIPADNPHAPEKIALGEKLFFDGRLSVDGTVACSTCHDPARAFTDGRPTSIGVKGGIGQRNAPTVLNALYNKTQFWDGRAQTLEEQAALPITNPIEMGQPSIDAAVTAIAAIEEYRQAFQQVFGHAPSATDLVRAIAAYERTQVSFDSLFDHFIAGDKNAIDASAQRGWDLFNTKARCNKCHALKEDQRDVTNFTDHDFHNIGIGIIRHNVVTLARQAEPLVKSARTEAIDRAALGTNFSALGRFLISKKESDIAAFKTPNIRNILVTGPYFHDGSQETLWDVIDHYNKGDGLQNPYLDQDIQPLALTEAEIDDLVAFMASLTSSQYREMGEKELARQREIARTRRPQRDTARAFGPSRRSLPRPAVLPSRNYTASIYGRRADAGGGSR
jgi:cytochrome c peroxidase